jgi:hypothetical protein
LRSGLPQCVAEYDSRQVAATAPLVRQLQDVVGWGSLPSLLRASSPGQRIFSPTGGGKVWQPVEKYRLAGRLSPD